MVHLARAHSIRRSPLPVLLCGLWSLGREGLGAWGSSTEGLEARPGWKDSLGSVQGEESRPSFLFFEGSSNTLQKGPGHTFL